MFSLVTLKDSKGFIANFVYIHNIYRKIKILLVSSDSMDEKNVKTTKNKSRKEIKA